MAVSKLFTLLAALGVIPILAGYLIAMEQVVFILYNLLLLVLLIVDHIITPKKSSIEIVREYEEKLSLGVENEIILRLDNHSKYVIKAQLTDEVPVDFEISHKELNVKVRQKSKSWGYYRVIPQKRGEFAFGTVYLRYNGILGLIQRTYKYDLHQSCKVYPNMKDLRKYSVTSLKKSEQLAGLKRSKGFDMGTDFESLREYSHGDDYKKINWTASARVNKIIVNQYQQEKNQTIFILIDSGRVMNSEIKNIKKLDYAINSAFVLSEIAMKKEDNIGLLVFDKEVNRYVKPGKGLGHFRLIGESMYNVKDNMVTTDYQKALSYLNQKHSRRSLLCIFTELFNQEEALQMISAIKTIARKHIPLVISIKDPGLNALAEGPIKRTEDLFTRAAAISVLEERERVKKTFEKAGIYALDVEPDKLSLQVINKYLDMKSKLLI